MKNTKSKNPYLPHYKYQTIATCSKDSRTFTCHHIYLLVAKPYQLPPKESRATLGKSVAVDRGRNSTWPSSTLATAL